MITMLSDAYKQRLRKIKYKLKKRELWQLNTFGYRKDDIGIVGEDAQILIGRFLNGKNPVMISRFGSVELNCVLNYLSIYSSDSVIHKSIRYVRGGSQRFWWHKANIDAMHVNAGFFPCDIPLIEQFCRLILEDIKQMDLLGSWLQQEDIILNQMPQAKRIDIGGISHPWFYKNPWTAALKNKRVLVIHPFSETITKQYCKKDVLFNNGYALPEFELITIKAVQSHAGNKTQFDSWFDAFSSMCHEIDQLEYDIAMIGCGAYGLPLAAYVKRKGKKAIHVGGCMQLFFGIKGKRWDEQGWYNEHWVRPAMDEIPKDAFMVEDACYW